MATKKTHHYMVRQVRYLELSLETWVNPDKTWSARVVDGGFNDTHGHPSRIQALSAMKAMVRAAAARKNEPSCKRCKDTKVVSEYQRVNPYSGPCPDCLPTRAREAGYGS